MHVHYKTINYKVKKIHLMCNDKFVKTPLLLLFPATPSQSLTLSTPPFIMRSTFSLICVRAFSRNVLYPPSLDQKSLNHPFGHLLDCFFSELRTKLSCSVVSFTLLLISITYFLFFYINEAPRVS